MTSLSQDDDNDGLSAEDCSPADIIDAPDKKLETEVVKTIFSSSRKVIERTSPETWSGSCMDFLRAVELSFIMAS